MQHVALFSTGIYSARTVCFFLFSVTGASRTGRADMCWPYQMKHAIERCQLREPRQLEAGSGPCGINANPKERTGAACTACTRSVWGLRSGCHCIWHYISHERKSRRYMASHKISCRQDTMEMPCYAPTPPPTTHTRTHAHTVPPALPA